VVAGFKWNKLETNICLQIAIPKMVRFNKNVSTVFCTWCIYIRPALLYFVLGVSTLCQLYCTLYLVYWPALLYFILGVSTLAVFYCTLYKFGVSTLDLLYCTLYFVYLQCTWCFVLGVYSVYLMYAISTESSAMNYLYISGESNPRECFWWYCQLCYHC